jgi:hypothetical protein
MRNGMGQQELIFQEYDNRHACTGARVHQLSDPTSAGIFAFQLEVEGTMGTSITLFQPTQCFSSVGVLPPIP